MPRTSRSVDPRIERSKEIVLRSALEELGAAGYGSFTIESVASRSGVAKSTIYRHWPDKVALIADAFQSFHQDDAPDLTSGTPRERVERIVAHVAEVVGHSAFAACIPALVEGAERDGRLRKFHHRFQLEARRPLVAVIAEGVASGDFPSHADPQLTALALVGVLFYQRVSSAKPFDPANAVALVDSILGPVRPIATRSRKR